MLQVSGADIQVLGGDPQARVSPLLCLSQNPSTDFLQPVRVQVPLPPGVTGAVCSRGTFCELLALLLMKSASLYAGRLVTSYQGNRRHRQRLQRLLLLPEKHVRNDNDLLTGRFC